MKTLTSIAGMLSLAFATSTVQARHVFEDTAKVTDVSPIYEKVNRPHKECFSEYVPERQHRRESIAGPLVGGVAGGVIGAQVGKGNGRVASSAIGAVVGAIVGDRLSDRGQDDYYEREVRRCERIDHWETRITGYQVAYRYRGRSHTTILPYDPGPRLRLRVAVEPMEPRDRIHDDWDR